MTLMEDPKAQTWELKLHGERTREPQRILGLGNKTIKSYLWKNSHGMCVFWIIPVRKGNNYNN